MKLLLNWVSEYVNLKGIEPKKLADLLVNIGFEVEEIVDLGASVSGVVTGKILSIESHPNADKLSVCKVAISKDKELQIVTAAKNITLGDIVPVALDGAALVGGLNIKNTTMRGVESQGMFCGGSELGVDDDIVDGASVDGILILDKKTKIGVDVKELLGLNDYILDVSITANRPDCQSVYGLAREIAVVLKRPLKPLDLKFKEIITAKSEHKIPSVHIKDSICSLYKGHFVTDIKVKPSPELIKRRLKFLGLKPINNVVDITNYVLLEVGQPLHAFDIGFIKGDIHVRKAKHNEKIKLLDGKEYVLNSLLDSSMFVIADDTKALAVAGVMGGEYSAVRDSTTDIFLESARFSKGSVRTTSRKLGIKTDSSTRFERGVDFSSVDIGYRRALTLFSSTGAGRVLTNVAFVAGDVPAEQIITTSAKQISDLLGIKVSSAKIIDILTRLEIKVSVKGKNLECKIPLFREDIVGFADLAEEVIRFYGYDKIQGTRFNAGAISSGGYSLKEKNIQKIKASLISSGALEVITYSFVNSDELDKLRVKESDNLRNVIKINNPLSEDYAVMRSQMVGGMLGTVKTNLSRKNDNFRLFEIARNYKPKALSLTELPEELDTLCTAFVGKEEDFYSLKAAVKKLEKLFGVEFDFKQSECSWLHPGISADIILNGKIIGNLGKIHPTVAKNFEISESVFVAQVELKELILQPMSDIKAKNLPKYPQVERDLAVVVKQDIAVGDLIKCIKNTGGELVESVELFDIYEGEQIDTGFKSVALKFVLRSSTHTLKDSEIQQVITQILDNLKTKFNAVLR